MEKVWKVIIADDEPIIREGIRNAVDWSALHMEVTAEAEDGEEAMELALRHQIHILLVDLNMPIMNGMELIKEVRKLLPECRIIIITGHDEFGYAQEAIRLQVDDYILKPAQPKQLHSVLSRTVKQLENSMHQSRHLKLASEQIMKNLHMLRERFCLEWMEGHLSYEEIREQLQFLRLPDNAPDILAVIRWPELSPNQSLMKERDRQLLLYAIENIAGELLEAYPSVIFRSYSDLIFIMVWGPCPLEVLTRIEQSVQGYLKLSVVLHSEKVSGGLAAVPAAYKTCKTAVYQGTQISPVAKRAKQYIQTHLHDASLTLESLAELLNVSPVYLSRVIKNELGVSFVAFVTQLRIQRAIQLLNSTDWPIHKIAEQVGYESQHYFSTAFKKVVGVPPIQYRKGPAAGAEGTD
ncbi:response regulator transcription factor [Paenibacillus alkalitolerans]|uniref:response regulator transcription factor n=1 Tax=Paenibacillus alkalitolerans TaxID=2799335 RepID=UPI0018F39599|nr:response regulator [Paenibacillus alkalitolerans]